MSAVPAIQAIMPASGRLQPRLLRGHELGPIEPNSIRPAIDQVFAFDKVKEAFPHPAMAKHFGKIVIKI